MRSFLTSAEEAVYGRFTGPPEQAVLERFFFLDDADRELVASKRGDHNRLGFSLQLVTARHLGRFLEDPLDVPGVVVDYVASQVKVADPSCVKAYLERKPTRFEHQAGICEVYGYRSYPAAKDRLLAWVGDQAWATVAGQLDIADPSVVKRYTERPKTAYEHAWEIRAAYGYRDFADAGVHEQLVEFMGARAWIHAEGAVALFEQARAWLRRERALLPGVSVLARLAATVRSWPPGSPGPRAWAVDASGISHRQIAASLCALLTMYEKKS